MTLAGMGSLVMFRFLSTDSSIEGSGSLQSGVAHVLT
jgi:hypothetical protein